MKKKILPILIAFITCFILTGCSAINSLQNYDVLDGTEFKSKLEQLGYTGIQISETDYGTQYLCDKGDIEISLNVITSKTTASTMYNDAVDNFEDIVNSHTSLESGSRARWTGTSDSDYIMLYLIDNTILALDGAKTDKEELIHIAETLTAS